MCCGYRCHGTYSTSTADEAYEAIATHLRDTIESLVAEQKAKNDNIPDGNPQPLPPQRNPKPVRRESWIAGTEPVAKRQATPYNTTWNSGPARGNAVRGRGDSAAAGAEAAEAAAAEAAAEAAAAEAAAAETAVAAEAAAGDAAAGAAAGSAATTSRRRTRAST